MELTHNLTVLIAVLMCGCYSCGHASWIRDSVDSFVNSAGNMMKSAGHYITVAVEKADKVAAGIQTIENLINDAIEENCDFHCPNDSVPRPNPKYKRKSNGCGSQGMKWETESLPLEQLSICCDKHDYCYGTCNELKDDCDIKFRRCLYKICDRNKKLVNNNTMKKCKGAAKLMYTGTLALGCRSYKDAQTEACICDHKSSDEL